MNEKEQEQALLGGTSGGATATEDWKSRYEESQRMLASARVEEGRVRKLDAENKALAKRIAELESGQRAKEIAGSLSESERGDIPDEYVGAAAKMADTAASRAVAGLNEELERLRREREEERAAEINRRKNDFLRQIDAKYPKLFSEIGAGGVKERAWREFMDNNKESVERAYNSCNLNGFAYHVDRFYRENLGVRPPEGKPADASVPDPVKSHGGGLDLSTDDPTRKYTREEFAALEKRANDMRANGRFKEYRNIVQELDTILSEGRLEG